MLLEALVVNLNYSLYLPALNECCVFDEVLGELDGAGVVEVAQLQRPKLLRHSRRDEDKLANLEE